MKAIWSYQKCGSEWVKLIITSCIYDRLVQDWQVANDTVRNYPSSNKGWCKTHRAELPAEIDGAIALIRHPLDIAMSAYRYRKVCDGNLGDMSTYEYLLQFCGNQGDPTFNKLNEGNLNDFLRNVRNDSRAICVKHEHLMAEPGILWPCLALMGAHFKPTHVAEFAKAMTPEYTRSLDRTDFLGKIRNGQYKVHTSPTLVHLYNEAFPEFRKAGYECEHIVGE